MNEETYFSETAETMHAGAADWEETQAWQNCVDSLQALNGENTEKSEKEIDKGAAHC